KQRSTQEPDGSSIERVRRSARTRLVSPAANAVFCSLELNREGSMPDAHINQNELIAPAVVILAHRPIQAFGDAVPSPTRPPNGRPKFLTSTPWDKSHFEGPASPPTKATTSPARSSWFNGGGVPDRR